MSAVLIHQPGMPSVMDAINPPTSFSARKTAASSVPVPGRIVLPPNPVTQKFGMSLGSQQQHQQQGSINSLLTPPSNISGDSLSPISSAASTTQHGTAASQGIPPFTPNGSWTGPSGSGLTPVMSSGAGPTPQSWGSSMNSFPPPKNMFSPLGNLVGASNSPMKSDALPPPPYNMADLNPPHHFATSNASMPSTMAQQHNGHPATHHNQQQLSYMQMSQPGMSNGIVSQPNPLSPGDAYLRAPPTPATSYYGSQSSTTPMQNNFPFSSASPPAISPPPRISPLSSGSSFPPPPPLSSTPNNAGQQPFGARPYQPYGAPMGMMSGHTMGGMHGYPFNSGATAAQHMQRFYDQGGHHHHHHGGMLGGPPLAHNDRPFKCDQCPQSFNRNHDLKRHKRIHLAVKPFPCGFCDKSFSRKDALKRHILVKGCGKAMAAKDGKGRGDDDVSIKSDSDGEGSVAHSGGS